MRAKFLIKTVVDVAETIIDEGAWKKISFTKNHVSLISCASLCRKPFFLMGIIFKFIIVLIGIIFKFNIVLIGIFFDNFHHNLFTFLSFD